STWGIGVTTSHGSGAAAAQDPIRREQDDSRYDRVVDVAEVMPGRMPARANCPADPAKRKAERDDACGCENDEARQSQLADSGRDRDERADQRSREAEGHGDAPEALEPSFRALDALGRDVELASVPLEERVPTVRADRPTAGRPEQI